MYTYINETTTQRGKRKEKAESNTQSYEKCEAFRKHKKCTYTVTTIMERKLEQQQKKRFSFIPA